MVLHTSLPCTQGADAAATPDVLSVSQQARRVAAAQHVAAAEPDQQAALACISTTAGCLGSCSSLRMSRSNAMACSVLTDVSCRQHQQRHAGPVVFVTHKLQPGELNLQPLTPDLLAGLQACQAELC